MVGKSVARWARAFSLRDLERRDRGGLDVGIGPQRRSIRQLSSGDWKTPHHWPGMSRPCTMRCASPPAMPPATRFRSRFVGQVGFGLGRIGRRKSGPSVQPAERCAPQSDMRQAGDVHHVRLRHGAGGRRLRRGRRRENRPIAAGSTVRNSERREQRAADHDDRPAAAAPGCRSRSRRRRAAGRRRPPTQVISTGRICSAQVSRSACSRSHARVDQPVVAATAP